MTIATAAVAKAIQVARRQTADAAGPVATNRATRRAVSCSSGRKTPSATIRIAAQNTEKSAYATGPTALATTTSRA